MSSCAQARAERTDARCIANSAAASASRPTRSGASTVTRAPPSPGSDRDRRPPPRRTSFGTATTSGSSSPAAGSPSSVAVRAATSRTSPARHVDQAFGRRRPGVGLGERQQQDERLGAAEPVGDRAGGGRVLGVARRGGLGEQQVLAHEQRRPASTAGVVEAHPGRDRPGQRLPRDAVLGETALADVVQERGDEQHVGP